MEGLMFFLSCALYILYRNNKVYTWQTQWNTYVYDKRIKILNENLEEYKKLPTYDEMSTCIYSYTKMMLYFWKSPYKMIEDNEMYNFVKNL